MWKIWSGGGGAGGFHMSYCFSLGRATSLLLKGK